MRCCHAGSAKLGSRRNTSRHQGSAGSAAAPRRSASSLRGRETSGDRRSRSRSRCSRRTRADRRPASARTASRPASRLPSRFAITVAAVTPSCFSAAYSGSLRDCHSMIWKSSQARAGTAPPSSAPARISRSAAFTRARRPAPPRCGRWRWRRNGHPSARRRHGRRRGRRWGRHRRRICRSRRWPE